MMLLDYLGDETRETIYGRRTGTRYVTGTKRPLILIDSRDYDAMLAMTDKDGQSLFQPHVAEVLIDE